MAKKPLSINDLNQMYSEANQADSEIFAEQRSNILLVAGEHYSKKNARYWNRIRDAKDLSSEQKVRLTKNHIQRITKGYVNNIVSYSPGVVVTPTNEKEVQHQKAAQLNNSVWQFAKYQQGMRLKTQGFAKDYVDIGETAAKIFWNPQGGKFIGWQQATHPETGELMYEEDGVTPVSSETPVFKGCLEIERLLPFNLLRCPSAKTMADSPYLIYRKMVDVEHLKALVGDDEEKLKYITETKDDTYLVFDGNNSSYGKSKNQTMVREHYFRPCFDYPTGYYYIAVEGGILFEGELPFGIFPIVYEGFDEVQTSPRHRSIIKQLRPYQSEINRCASKMAEHHVTLGDDKLLVASGTKITSGVHLPGIRSIQYSGMQPEVLPGRSGDQYVGTMTANITEMYQVANFTEDAQMKDTKADPFAQLFQSVRDKKKFTVYSEKFENFLCNIAKTYLDLARFYFDDQTLVPMIGKNEYVNISEFKTTSDLCYTIKVEPMTDDITTIMGRTLSINHALQYVGNQLSKEDIGKLMRAMPFGNLEESFNDLTIDYDSATNMILALDRGEQVTPFKYDEAKYFLKRLIYRTRQSDFRTLPPNIQANYDAIIQAYQDIEVQQQQELARAQAEFIPSGGARVKVDYYVQDPNNPSRTVRATLPAEAVDWLIKRLAEQGSSQDQLMELNTGAVAEMADQFATAQAKGLMSSPSGAGPVGMPGGRIIQ